jgi:hypothetical protein
MEFAASLAPIDQPTATLANTARNMESISMLYPPIKKNIGISTDTQL